MASLVRIGTSGWSYPTGRGTWNGVFYPPKAGRSRGKFDELAFYAEHFDTVEVNSSFYRIPAESATRSWAERTPAGFEFSLKLFQKFTHPGMFRKATGADHTRPDDADVETFLRAIEPIAAAGKLGALLAQFPPSFKYDTDSLDYLGWLLSRLEGLPVAVELRHRSWSDRLGDTLHLLDQFDAAWTQIDEPKFRFSIRQNFLPNVKGFYYMRLHGRNAAQWWTHEASEDRYNYLYTPQELQPFADAAAMARRLVKKLYVYMNNHFEAKAVANAVQLREQLGEPIPGEYPESFLERYPDLRRIVSGPRALF